MTEERQQSVIQKVCGWTPSKFDSCWNNAKLLATLESPPDYINDLNAMHEAVQSQIKAPNVYNDQLEKVVLGHPLLGRDAVAEFLIRHATAAQRAEAFLKTIGLWKEDEA